MSSNNKCNQVQVQPRLQTTPESLLGQLLTLNSTSLHYCTLVFKDSTKAAALGGSLKPACPSCCLTTQGLIARGSALLGLPSGIAKTLPGPQFLYVWVLSSSKSLTFYAETAKPSSQAWLGLWVVLRACISSSKPQLFSSARMPPWLIRRYNYLTCMFCLSRAFCLCLIHITGK